MCCTSVWGSPLVLIYNFAGKINYLILREDTHIACLWWKGHLTTNTAEVPSVLTLAKQKCNRNLQNQTLTNKRAWRLLELIGQFVQQSHLSCISCDAIPASDCIIYCFESKPSHWCILVISDLIWDPLPSLHVSPDLVYWPSNLAWKLEPIDNLSIIFVLSHP